MFEKLRKIFKNREEKEKHNYDLTFDNVAIPEVHESPRIYLEPLFRFGESYCTIRLRLVRNRFGLRTSSAIALELVTPNGHEQPCLRSSSDCFMVESRVVHGCHYT